MNLRPTKPQLLRWVPNRLVMTNGDAGNRQCYLTFDDGPHPAFTSPMLDLLARHRAKASFFLIGANAARYPDLVRRIVDGGHLLGNHSWDHPRMTRLPLSEQIDQIERTDRILAPFDSHPRHRFRPPRGVFAFPLLRYCWRVNRALVYWSYDTLDYRHEPAAVAIARLRERPPKPGDILLMHDDNQLALDILEALLPEWQEGGLAFSALSQESPCPE